MDGLDWAELRGLVDKRIVLYREEKSSGQDKQDEPSSKQVKVGEPRWCSGCGQQFHGLAAAFRCFTRGNSWNVEYIHARFCSRSCCDDVFPKLLEASNQAAS